jgi:hypothetical protein
VNAPLAVHVAAGGVSIVAGFVALYSVKGRTLHRRSGRVFVYAMVVMAVLGGAIAAAQGGEASAIAGALTAYLVVTALATVRPPESTPRAVAVGGVAVALALGVGSLALGAHAVSLGGAREGIPAVVLFKFATVALLAAAGDARVLRTGARQGAARLRRHLWRMCFALYVAAASFFLGQADVMPQAFRSPMLRAVPVLAVVLTMLYWLWRVRQPSRSTRRSAIARSASRLTPSTASASAANRASVASPRA